MQDNSLPMPEDTQAPYKNEVTVAASAISMGEELPAVGDEVDLQVKGTVSRISGDTVCVTPLTVNDEPAPPVPPDDSGAAAEGGQDPMDAIRQKLLAGAQADDAGPAPGGAPY